MITVMPLADLLRDYVPGSYPQPWTWDDEENDLHNITLGESERTKFKGDYQRALEKHMATSGWGDEPALLGNDGRVWDGHHRIVAAKRLGFESVPVEFGLGA